MFKKWEHQKGTCARCGKEVTNGDWIKYCRNYIILGKEIILHFCENCYVIEENEQ